MYKNGIRFISTKRKSNIKMGYEILDESHANLVAEGFFKSYPNDVVERTIKDLLNKERDLCGYFDIYPSSVADPSMHDKENDFQIITLATERFNNTLKEKISKKLDLCGWYISDTYREISDGGEHYFATIIEPKYPNDAKNARLKSDKTIDKVKIFYHISFKKFENKILSNGLLPSISSRKQFYHPDRVYLFSDKDVAKEFVLFHKTTHLSFTNAMNKRKTKHGTNVIDADDRYQDKESKKEPIVAFEVNLKKMKDDGREITIFHDNRFNEKDLAYFTQNYIPPKYLKKMEVSY